MGKESRKSLRLAFTLLLTVSACLSAQQKEQSDSLVRLMSADYIRQVKNPYCHISNGMIVKISFAGQDTLEACLSRCISPEKKF